MNNFLHIDFDFFKVILDIFYKPRTTFFWFFSKFLGPNSLDKKIRTIILVFYTFLKCHTKYFCLETLLHLGPVKFKTLFVEMR